MNARITKTRIAAAILIVGAIIAVAIFTSGYLKDRNIAADDKLPDVDAEQLATLLEGGKPGIVEFYTTSCPWCAKLEPELARVAARFGDKMFVVKVNVEKEKNARVAVGYSVRVVPTMMFFDASGKADTGAEGFMETKDIIEIIDELGMLKP